MPEIIAATNTAGYDMAGGIRRVVNAGKTPTDVAEALHDVIIGGGAAGIGAAANVLKDLRPISAGDALYLGYSSCPLTGERDKVVLAEFGYGGRRLPSFANWRIGGAKHDPLDWLSNQLMLPTLYRRPTLKGRDRMAKPSAFDNVAAVAK